MSAGFFRSSYRQFFRNRFTLWTSSFFLVLTIAFILIAGLRSGWPGTDYQTYLDFYAENFKPGEYLANPMILFTRDPGFFFITSVMKYYIHIPYEIFIFFFAAAVVATKMRSIATLSNSPLVSAFIYFSYFFIMHEMITIRAGAAAAIFLLAIPSLVQGRYMAYSIIIAIAMCFHITAIIALPLVFLSAKGERPLGYLVILFTCVAGAMMKISIDPFLLFLPGNGNDLRIAYYILESQNGVNTLTLFNRLRVPNLILCVTLLYNFWELKAASPYASHIIRIFAISLILFYSLSGFPVFAVRLAELLGIVSILAWPLLIYLIKSNWTRIALFGSVGILFLTAGLREYLYVSPF